MGVNTELLQKQVQALKLSKETGGDYYKELFAQHSDVCDAYGGIDPDAVPKSARYIMMANNELQAFMQLPKNFNEERDWRSALSNFKEHYSDSDVPLKLFNKTKEPFLALLQKHAGGMSAEQKKGWEELLDKAYADMKKYGWI